MNIEQVWSDYRSGLKSFLHSRVSNPADVDDLLQDILVKTHQNIHTVKSQSSLKSWVFQIANNAIIDFYRKNKSTLNSNADDLWIMDDSENAQQALANCIEPFIKSLPQETSDLLMAIDLYGQSQKAYAQMHNISYSTLKSRVQEGRRQLRHKFENCCQLSFDTHGGVIDYSVKSDSCDKC